MQSAWGRLEERDRLVTAHLPLADGLARRFVSDADTLDDLRQVAAIGLLKAAARYDAARGVPFAAYAIPVVRGELRHYRRDRAWPVRVPRSAQAARPVAVALDEAAAGVDGLGGAEDRLVVEGLVRALRRPEREVVRRYFLADRTQAEVAGELGLTQIQVSRLLRAALTAMRARLEPAL
jgi:RNA polymerase sigma-B factor